MLAGLVGSILGDRPYQVVSLDRRNRNGVESLLIALAPQTAHGADHRLDRLIAGEREPAAVPAHGRPLTPISGTNVGKPYPPVGRATQALPPPNPPRAIGPDTVCRDAREPGSAVAPSFENPASTRCRIMTANTRSPADGIGRVAARVPGKPAATCRDAHGVPAPDVREPRCLSAGDGIGARGTWLRWWAEMRPTGLAMRVALRPVASTMPQVPLAMRPRRFRFRQHRHRCSHACGCAVPATVPVIAPTVMASAPVQAPPARFGEAHTCRSGRRSNQPDPAGRRREDRLSGGHAQPGHGSGSRPWRRLDQARGDPGGRRRARARACRNSIVCK